MFLIWITILIIISYKFGWSWWLNRKRWKKIENIPSPPAYPLLGTLYHYLVPPEKTYQVYRNLFKTYGNVYKMWFCNNISIEISDCDDAEVILSSTKYMEKPAVYNFFRPWLGNSLFISPINIWHKKRKLLTPAFHFNMLQEFLKTFIKQSNTLVEELNGKCDQPFIYINPLIAQFSMKNITETAMGSNSHLTEKLIKIYRQSVDNVVRLIQKRFTNIWFYNDIIYNLSPDGKKFRKSVNLLNKFTNDMIKKQKKIFSKKDDKMNGKHKILIDLLFSSQKNADGFDDKYIQDEVNAFIFAGQDTTYTSICFILFNLANNPDIQEKVYKESAGIIGNNLPTIELLNKLIYTEMCIKESLRLHTTVPHISRMINEDIHLPSGYCIPAGAKTRINIMNLHLNPNIYPEPKKYDPERFSQENSRKKNPFAFIGFSAGPRNCLGQKYAMIQMKTAIWNILKNFKLEAVDKPEDLIFLMGAVLRTKNDIRIKFIRRH